ncbi:MAG: FAD-dependent oxidoreductase [Nitrospirae bacterium]|nr:FAD-dependent oxidoreductase [Nitrospirota bacterium]
MKKSRVLILGGGAAGLSAASYLCDKGYRVCLVEGREHLGGGLCAPSLEGGPPVDAVPPILWGGHQEIRKLFTLLGSQQRVHFPTSLHHTFALSAGRVVALPRLWGPASVRGPATIAGFSGISMRDRMRLVNVLERLWEKDLTLPTDLDERPVTELFDLTSQSESAVRQVWTPLSRFLLGDDPSKVSAALGASSLRALLFGTRRNNAIGLLTGGMAETLIHPAEAHLRRSGAEIRLGKPATRLLTQKDQVMGVTLQGGEPFSADWYLAALGPDSLAALLPDRWLAKYASFQSLTEWDWSPRVTIRLECRGKETKPWLRLLATGTYDWAVGIGGGKKQLPTTQIWLVASGQPALLKRSDADLRELAVKDLQGLVTSCQPDHIQHHRVFRSERATPALRPGTRRLRATPQSPVANLFVAGTWTDTGLPASVESAILSGRQCAEAIGHAVRARIVHNGS